MGVVDMIKSKFASVERLERELATLNSTGANLTEEIKQFQLQAHELEDPEQLTRNHFEILARENRLRKIDFKIIDVRARLDGAREEARRKQLAKLRSEHAAAASAMLDNARAAGAAVKRVVAAREALSDAGFRLEFELLPLHPGLPGMVAIGDDLLDAYEIAIGLAAAPVSTVPKPLTPPEPPIDRSGAQRAVRLDELIAKSPPPRAPRRETAQDGEVLFYQFRGFLDHPRKGQIQANDCVALTPEEAAQLMKSGSGDIVTPEVVEAIDATLGAAVPTHLTEVAE